MSALGRRYWTVWTAAVQSNLADGVFMVAVPLLAARQTDSPVLIAGVALAGRLPWLLFALHAGALVDRLDRRSTMRSINIVRSLTLGILSVAVSTGVATLPLLFAVAFVLGVAETLFDTSAQSIVPRLVSREQLQRANGHLYAGEVAANGFAGPSLGGFLAGLSVSVAFAVTGLAYAGAAATLAMVTGRFRPYRERRTGLHRDIRDGLAYLAGHRVLRTLAMVGGLTNMAWFAWQSVLVLYAVDPGPMGLNEFGYGLLLTAGAAGSVLGSFLVDRMARFVGRARLLRLCVVGWAVWLGGPALSADPWLVGALVVAGSAAGMWWNIISVSYRQQAVPDAMLGRVNAAYRLFAWGAMPVGAALGGLLGELIGLRALFAVTALGTLALVVPLRRIVTDRALRDRRTHREPGHRVPRSTTKRRNRPQRCDLQKPQSASRVGRRFGVAAR